MKILFYLIAGVILLFIAHEVFAAGKPSEPAVSVVKHPAWAESAVIYELNTRQFTALGTFKAIIPRLPELKKLGVDIIWLMPVHPIGVKNRKGTLGSPYAVKDYYAVNPEFGSREDFKSLVQAVHREGMHVIIDMVANHTAWDNSLIKTHPEWYQKDASGKIIPPVPDWDDVAKLDYAQEGLREYMTGVLKYWVKEMGVDGFRCDVASMVPADFWERARAEIDAIRPTFWLAEAESPGLLEKAFDCDYASEYYVLFNSIAAGKAKACEIPSLMETDSMRYPAGSWRMHFTSNHDQNSWRDTAVTRLGEKGAEAFAMLTYALPGRPLIYNGQETGSTHKLEFFEKDSITWRESAFREMYGRLSEAYRKHPALYRGDCRVLDTSRTPEVLALVRNDSATSENVLALANLSPEARTVSLDLPGNPEAIYRGVTPSKEKGLCSFRLGPWEHGLYLLQ
ncbi:MAG: alpha-amylase family glycosyl hydrolase [Candidatus Eremiobacteraeota bacterium]|nr:alpha-amylase family glycosyl hydrolase [Candidatus Eremiobacteraeota bacterium]